MSLQQSSGYPRLPVPKRLGLGAVFNGHSDLCYPTSEMRQPQGPRHSTKQQKSQLGIPLLHLRVWTKEVDAKAEPLRHPFPSKILPPDSCLAILLGLLEPWRQLHISLHSLGQGTNLPSLPS